jgi:mono/diheme cytochrome c family protein
VLFGAVMASLAAAQVHAGEYDPADVRGSLLFSTRCTTCHGNGGDQVPGVAVLSGRFRRAVSDEDLAGIIGNGLPGTGMPPGNAVGDSLTADELADLLAYLRSLKPVD